MNPLLLTAIVLTAGSPETVAQDEMFPFSMPLPAAGGAGDVSAWIARPAGKDGFVQAIGGRLAIRAASGEMKPIRFWGTNLCAAGCFPSHEQAQRLAAGLARLGFNCVRMHHMDRREIWGDGPGHLAIDPKQLDRLDYLVHQLKLHGVYTNLNLHISRWLDEADGFPGRAERPKYDKGLDNFEPRMIELQKKFARDLLRHVNPYTGAAYADEPAVAFVEINNENALFEEWRYGRLDRLPEPYSTTFRKLWNLWLRQKYGGTERWREAWNRSEDAAADSRLWQEAAIAPLRAKDAPTPPVRADWADFLWDTERAYWLGMHRYLKEELGVRPPVSGTQVSWSPVHIQARLDYLDAHAYWHHPAFPGRDWDAGHWTVGNTALADTPPGILGRLAAKRVAGLPFTVSEYNHPAPNVYAAEGFPMAAAFGALQGWDGIYTFSYSGSSEYESSRIVGFFDFKGDPAKLVHLPACAAMFVRGDVTAARTTLLTPVSREAERRKLRQTFNPWEVQATMAGMDARWSAVHAIAMELGEDRARAPDKAAPAPPDAGAPLVSDTGQMRWDASRKGGGYLTVDSPRTKLFTGFIQGRSFCLGNVVLTPGRTRLDWATVSLVCVDGAGFDQPGRMLVAATGWMQNRGAKLEYLDGDKVTLGDRWGQPPVLCEGVGVEIVLPVAADRVRCWPLDPAGVRRDPWPAVQHNGKALLRLGPEHKTLWYEVEIK
jgi:hypothetical protein